MTGAFPSTRAERDAFVLRAAAAGHDLRSWDGDWTAARLLLAEIDRPTGAAGSATRIVGGGFDPDAPAPLRVRQGQPAPNRRPDGLAGNGAFRALIGLLLLVIGSPISLALAIHDALDARRHPPFRGGAR